MFCGASRGKSVYLNVIAKNFETLEPGSHFRVLRQAMAARYTKTELAARIVVTGTRGSRLEEIARENGYTFLSFPERVGGRYSAFSPVCLLPIAVAGAGRGGVSSGRRGDGKKACGGQWRRRRPLRGGPLGARPEGVLCGDAGRL